jgi:hypothetical protein
MNKCMQSDAFMSFPPCSSIEQVEFEEWLIFARFPSLTKFSREITRVERLAGVTDPHALVAKTNDGITRYYGMAISPN